MTKPTAHIVDDDSGICDAIGMLLESVSIACRTFNSAAAFLNSASKKSRGCLVVDIRMPGMSGLELFDELIDRGITLPVIFITGHGDIPMAVAAMRRGALDFIRKPFRDQDLLDRVNEAMLKDAAESSQRSHIDEIQNKIGKLTPRETQVFHRVAEGGANKVIAIELGISERTVEIHRSQVKLKTECKNLAELVKLKLALKSYVQAGFLETGAVDGQASAPMHVG